MKTVRWTGALAAVAAVAAAATLAIVAPARAGDSSGVPDEPRSIQALREEIAFDKARLELAKSKAFYISVDAPRRTVTIEMNGVPLRVCAIERLELDRRMVQRRKAEAFVDSLARPFHLVSKTGTIPETPPPVDVDTTRTKEAEKARQKAKFSDADLTLTYDRDLIVHITTRADSAEAATGGPVRTRVLNRLRLLRLMARSWLNGGPFREQGEIFLQIGRTDARALYWAVPDSSGLALRL